MSKFEVLVILLLVFIAINMVHFFLLSYYLNAIQENQRYLIEMIEVIYDQNS